VPADIYVPADAKAAKLRAIERAGATAVRIDGDRRAVTDACIAAVDGESDAGSGNDEQVYYASHAWDPAFYAGTATMAYELALQRDWTVPDAVVCPLGHGTMFLGAYRGFRALREAGWTDRLPRLLGAQAVGYAPVVDALGGSADGRDHETNDLADGIRIREPARQDQLLDAVEATDGDAIAIGREAVETELARLHRAGFYTEPTCAVAPAALRAFRERGVLSPDDDVVVALSGSGLKN
jgi:threonine synthase